MRMRAAVLVLFVCVVGVWGVAVPAASGAEEVVISRTEYVERAEPVCKTNVQANKRIFDGAKQQVKEGKLKLASTHFFRAATAFAKTIAQLEEIPRPTEDAVKLTKWLGLLRTERGIIEKIARALRAEDKHKAESESVALNRGRLKANNAVLGFGFNYCLLQPSRFG